MKSSFITAKGFQKLQDELNFLWKTHRPEITKKVAWAASLGDRSENADYQYNKKLLREIDRRIRYLQKRLPDLKVVKYSEEQEGRVFFGATVEIENDNGESKSFKIVGYDEIFDQKNVISLDSPMARALLGREVDDEINVQTPTGKMSWYIVDISY
ncbi:hypothetical protein LCGC14_1102590 [marine sediment metagenome]|uniref:Transcription elongation factor GreA n=1 Tax=marine sediment metagenome TaxID=412755 RepID=A0A0F9M911_9ZZZZ|nr:transcription elongation factor GreB [Methylophaga sp.]